MAMAAQQAEEAKEMAAGGFHEVPSADGDGDGAGDGAGDT
jgi:hypothetical protein